MMKPQATPQVLRAMLDKADELLAVARLNFDVGYVGDASSRAFYAAFHAICAVLASDGMAFSSHAETLGAFNRDFIKTGRFPRDMFRKLQRLFEDRQIADYHWNVRLDRSEAVAAIADADWTVHACRDYLLQAGRLKDGA